MDRSKKIIRTSMVSIAVNLVLVLFKLAVGILSNSIAVILDAVNNLGDALSSIITIIGTKLAGKAPDRKHPYGYGRIEHLTSIIIAAIILTAGITSLKESFIKILHPEPASYTVVSVVIIAVAVVAKFFCGRYVKSVGEKINAPSLVISGSEAFMDAVLSFATLLAAGITMLWGISLEGFLGLIIAAIIVKAGCEMLFETLGELIGSRADRELSDAIKQRIREIDGVLGAYDLILHSYGPTDMIGSVHVEIPDSMNAKEMHKLTHRISKIVYDDFGMNLTVGIYASNNTDREVLALRRPIEAVIAEHPEVLQMHGFYADLELKEISFDIVVDFGSDTTAIRNRIKKEVEKICPGYRFIIAVDLSYTD